MRKNKEKVSLLWRCIAWLQIVLQLLIPYFVSVPAYSQPSPNDVLPESESMSTLASSLASNDMHESLSEAQGYLISGATSAASSQVQAWLSQFGTARVQLNVDQNGNWDNSAIDFLLPLYDNQKSMLFTQLGMRAPDGRTTTNIGMGVRTFNLENWMLGANVFFDDDITGKNRRVGFGAEAWMDNLKLSANTYLGTTTWHQSRDFDDYNEKPADGYDVRAEGYLPAFPQLGAKVMYEQYYGDNVALFDTDHLQTDPSAVTAGINYTPVPLIEFGIDYKRGQDSLDDTQFTLALRYDLGQSWRAQTDPDNVRLERRLAGSRHDLVERNNQIVLQYQRKDKRGVNKLMLQALTDNAPADGITSNTLEVYAADRDNQPVVGAPIAWSLNGNATADTSSSVTNSQGMATINVTSTTPETVQVTAQSGAVSAMQDSHFNAVTVSHIELTLDKDGSVADGRTPNSAVATVTDINNRPIANTRVQWTVSSPATLQNTGTVTDEKGQVKTQFVSTKAGEVTLRIAADNVNAEQQSTFVPDTQNTQISEVKVLLDNSPADGKSPDVALVTVKDNYNNPVSGAHVTLSADKNTVVFGALSAHRKNSDSITDDKGQLQVLFTDTVAQDVTLTAQLDNGNEKSAQAHFSADANTAQIVSLELTKNKSVADGAAGNEALAIVKDAQGNPLKGLTVAWHADKTTVKMQSTSTTDETGKTVMPFSDTVAETVTLTALLANGNQQQIESQFTGDPATAALSSLTVTKDGSVANGSDANSAQVYVKDENGNPLAGVVVSWSADKNGVVFTPGGPSDSDGKATVTYISTVAQQMVITAALASGSKISAASSFIGDQTSAKIGDFTVTSGAVADGVAANTATVKVVDAMNNPLANTAVTWGTTGSAELSASQGVTDKNGMLNVTLKDKVAETVDVRVELASGVSQTKPSTFIADPASAKISAFTVTTDALANGIATNSAVVTVTDAFNNPLEGESITWTVDGSAMLATTNGTTDAEGKASVTFTDIKAETVHVTAQLNGKESQTKDSRFIADTSTATIASLASDVTDSVANGSATNRMTAVVVDGNGNALPDQEITWSSDKATVAFANSDKTDSDGKTSVSFTDTVAESLIVKAELKNGSKKTQPSRFIADISTATITEMVVAPDNQRADGEQSDVVTVKVKDATGNLLSGQAVNWTVSRQDVTVTPSGATDEKGEATAMLQDQTGGSVDVTATLTNGSTLTRTANFLSINVTALTSDTKSTSANNHDVITFTATVKDSGGSVVSNTPVKFTTTGSATLSASEVKTDASGQAVVTLKDAVGEAVTVSATSGINAQDTGKSLQATFEVRQITTLVAGGKKFTVDSGFPKTGFYGATFLPLVDGDAAHNANYTWSVDQGWVVIDSNTGALTMLATGPDSSNKTVTITGTPKYGDQPVRFTFTVNHWIVAEGRNSHDPQDADTLCPSRGRQVPPAALLSNGAPGSYGTRSVGTFWGEWGDLSQYNTWLHSGYVESMWTSDTGTGGQRIYVSWRDGFVNQTPIEGVYGVDIVCKKDI